MALLIAIVAFLALISVNARQLIVSALTIFAQLIITFWKWSILVFVFILALCCG